MYWKCIDKQVWTWFSMLTASFNSRMFAWEPFISWHFHSQLLSHLVYDIKLRRSIAFIETVWKEVGSCNQNKHAYFLWFSSLQVLWWYVLINVTLISLVLGIWLLELFSLLLFEPSFFSVPVSSSPPSHQFRHPAKRWKSLGDFICGSNFIFLVDGE